MPRARLSVGSWMAWLPLGSSAGCSSGGTGPPPGPMTTGPRTLTAIWAIASPPSVTPARKPTTRSTAGARRVVDHIGGLLPGILGRFGRIGTAEDCRTASRGWASAIPPNYDERQPSAVGPGARKSRRNHESVYNLTEE